MITTVLNNIALINGDCMGALKSFPDNSYDLAIVDPPYGINAGKKHVGPGWVTRESKEKK